MKIMTIVGTRPEIIRLSRIIPQLDKLCHHILVHTGQNFSANLKDVFFDELKIRTPDHYMNAVGDSAMATVANIIKGTEEVLLKHKPDRLLILGDTNSGLSAFVAKRMGIPVFHMEAGNRCFDIEVPEEVNRPVIDNCSTVLMPYTGHSRQHLLNEGYNAKNIFVTGNPIGEVLNYYMPQIEQSNVLKEISLTAQNYFLVTLHREENIDHKERLQTFITVFEKLAKKYKKKVVISVHPRLKNRLEAFKITPDKKTIVLQDALGFFDFIHLQKNAHCVLSDSGTVPEESAILKVPNVLLRTSTERPELLECGSLIVSGRAAENILAATEVALTQKPSWDLPKDYKRNNVSNIATHIILSHIL